MILVVVLGDGSFPRLVVNRGHAISIYMFHRVVLVVGQDLVWRKETMDFVSRSLRRLSNGSLNTCWLRLRLLN